ncbi:PIN domain-containing protein [Adhaeribacter terreus]|uniref:PIN domain-containing protein n=1 Tax=Adhaeribacter terreus TaxID=529703 RepID=A0ABW0EGM7_9BACT
MKDYYSYNISLGELIAGNFNKDFIWSYYHLTAIDSNGFCIVPKKYYLQNLKLENYKFVIDFSTCLLFYELSKNLDLKFGNFIVPNSFIKIIDNQIFHEKHDPKSNLSISIENGKVVPHFLPEDFKEKRLVFLEDLKEWCLKHVETQIPEEKLDLIRALREKKEISGFIEFYVDNVTLANRENCIMLSDDSFYFKFVNPQDGKIISSEYFLNYFFTSNQKEIYEYLLRKKYVGLTLDLNILSTAYFNQFKSNQQYVFNVALLNLALKINYIPQNVNLIFSFLKELALKGTISDEKYLIDATNLVFHLLSSFPSLEPALLLTDLIQKEFFLLPKHLLITLKATTDALKILN